MYFKDGNIKASCNNIHENGWIRLHSLIGVIFVLVLDRYFFTSATDYGARNTSSTIGIIHPYKNRVVGMEIMGVSFGEYFRNTSYAGNTGMFFSGNSEEHNS